MKPLRVEPQPVAIDQVLVDQHLLGAALGDDPQSWRTWLAVLRAAFALPMSVEDRALFGEVAGDREPPSQRVRELWSVVGRGAGKSRIAAALAVFFACFCRIVLLLAKLAWCWCWRLRAQAQVVFRYALGFLEVSPVLRREIASATMSEIRLRNGAVIAVHANSYRTVRGKTLLACVFDEVAYWRDEMSAIPDVESYRAVMPSLARTGGMLVAISTGYRRAGLLFAKHRDHFGAAGDDVLVVQGASAIFNPTLAAEMIERAKAADPEAAESEWGGGFRTDIAAFLDDATIEAAIDHARPLELPPRAGLRYQAFADPSGGRHDAFCLGIGHQENDRLVADVVRGKRAPFDPHYVVAEYAALLRDYGLREVIGDNYSAAWAESSFKDAGIRYERSEVAKSQLYIETLPLFMRGVVSIPNHAILIRELRLLERRATRVGRDIVDHGRNGSDDHCNVLCGMLHTLATVRPLDDLSWVCGDGPLPAMWHHPLMRHPLFRRRWL